MSVGHELKTWPEFFARLVSGEKTFDVRKDDRGYQAGDVLVLREYDPGKGHECDDPNCFDNRYSGRSLSFRVGFVFKQGFGVDLGGYVVLSLLPLETSDG
jgi:Domain of unknown function (DUF3850)